MLTFIPQTKINLTLNCKAYCVRVCCVHLDCFTGVTYRSLLVEAFHRLEIYGGETRAVNNVSWILPTEEELPGSICSCRKVHIVTRKRGGEI